MHTLVVQVYALAGHAHVGTCTCISAIDLVHGFVNMHAAQPSVWHFSALVCPSNYGLIFNFGPVNLIVCRESETNESDYEGSKLYSNV